MTASEMIQYACLGLLYHFGSSNRLALPEQGGLFLINFVYKEHYLNLRNFPKWKVDIVKLQIHVIIYLVGKPIDRCKLSTPAKKI